MKNMFINLFIFNTLVSSVLVITSKNPVISVAFLVSVFISAALYLILAGIDFIGISYIIVYVGAIIVLFLFVIMMIDIKVTDLIEVGKQYTKNIPLALSVSILFLIEILSIIPFLGKNDFYLILNKFNLLFLNVESGSVVVSELINTKISETIIVNMPQIKSLALSLYMSNAIILVSTGILLLLSMLAPIYLSRVNS